MALAAEQVGAAQRCLDMAVAYAKERIQFGRAIGSFQAIKHRCADMLVLVEGARSAAVHAAEVADTDELASAASVAKMACSEAFLAVALDNMRIHGGIGFTWEHDAHLYVRRAKATQLIFGSPDYHAQRLADLVTSICERTIVTVSYSLELPTQRVEAVAEFVSADGHHRDRARRGGKWILRRARHRPSGARR